MFPTFSFSNKLNAFLVLVLSIILVIKSRKNIPLTIMFIFILYVNYSVVISEYFVGGQLSVPFSAVKTEEIYGETIKILLLFMSILTLFFNGRGFEVSKDTMVPRDNSIIFFSIIITLLYLLNVGIERGDYSSYGVKISPIFEYAKLLFLFAFFYSGESKFKKFTIFLLVLIYILQDTYYGGRITTLQLIIFFSVTILVRKLSFIKIIFFSFIGIFLMSSIAVYRANYSFNNLNISELVKNLSENYFAFDTATYAYYASATHIAATNTSDLIIRLNSLYEFLISIFFGSQDISSEVTNLVVKLGYFNLGGGFIPTHFYFWLGWTGVIIIGFTIVLLINNLRYGSPYQNLLLLGIIINVPRWYLYSPNQLFRGALFFVSVLYVVFQILSALMNKNEVINKDEKVNS
ncbi:hypothetical protein ACWV26_08520 [Rummeliibacillus sp. JY-2-4R]